MKFFFAIFVAFFAVALSSDPVKTGKTETAVDQSDKTYYHPYPKYCYKYVCEYEYKCKEVECKCKELEYVCGCDDYEEYYFKKYYYKNKHPYFYKKKVCVDYKLCDYKKCETCKKCEKEKKCDKKKVPCYHY